MPDKHTLAIWFHAAVIAGSIVTLAALPRITTGERDIPQQTMACIQKHETKNMCSFDEGRSFNAAAKQCKQDMRAGRDCTESGAAARKKMDEIDRQMASAIPNIVFVR